MQAVLKGDSETKLEELKKIVKYGEKLGKDVTPDKRKLEILLARENEKSKKVEFSAPSERTVEYTLEEYLPKNTKKNSNQNQSNNQNNSPTKEKKKETSPEKKEKVVSEKNDITEKNIIENKSEKEKKVDSTKDDKEEKKEDKKDSSKSSKINNFIDSSNGIKLISAKNDIIKVDFNGKISKNSIKHSTYKFNDNFENIIDISTKYAFANEIKLSLENVEKVTVLPKNNNSTRIKLTNNSKLKLSYALTNKQLIIKVESIKAENKKDELEKRNSKNEKKSTKNNSNEVAFEPQNLFPALKTSNKKKIIVIDPGHGGHDPGATGPNKRYEKVVTFEIAKMVYNKLKQSGYKVYLTRNKDNFIKVIDRTVLANNKNADIFISIHANSIVKAKANHTQGIETYFLSPARNERAKHVAEKENIEDISGMSNSSKNAFLESLNRPRITASHKLAIDVHAGMLQNGKTKYADIQDAGVKEGPFWVLVGAQMPSILIELGYISHPEESKRLYSKEYQKLLANGIANGVESYFSKNP